MNGGSRGIWGPVILLAWEELQVKVWKLDFGGNIPKNIQQKSTHTHNIHLRDSRFGNVILIHFVPSTLSYSQDVGAFC